jgi:uncharacterized protein (TIGR00255 family)
MTGYARVRRATPAGELTLSIRAVNHRGLDVRAFLGAGLEPFESALRAALARHVVRGHLEVRAHLRRDGQGPLAWNRTLMASYLEACRQAAAEFAIPFEPDLNAAFRIPGILVESESEPDAAMEGEVAAAAAEAARLLNAEREREGVHIAAELRAYHEAIVETAAEIEALRGEILPKIRARLEERLAELLAGAAVEPQRLVQEAAIIADRSDIAEEIARLKIHCAQFAHLLDGGGEIGKKIEFLVQEMHRESGTILSKTGSAGEAGLPVTARGLRLKSAIEKIREQAANLE